MLKTLIAIAYLGVGLLVASNNNYLDIDNLKDVLSAVLAVLLWPLVLADVNLHFESLNNDGKKN
jgi:hypothetical protein